MKLTLALLFPLLLCTTVLAQTPRGAVEFPNLITQSFYSDFPDAQNIHQRKVGSLYAFRFVLNGFTQEAHYSGTGTWSFTEISVPENRMPPRSIEHCRSQYPGASILRTGYHDEEDNRFYHIEISLNGSTRQLRYDDDGNFIR